MTTRSAPRPLPAALARLAAASLGAGLVLALAGWERAGVGGVIASLPLLTLVAFAAGALPAVLLAGRGVVAQRLVVGPGSPSRRAWPWVLLFLGLPAAVYLSARPVIARSMDLVHHVTLLLALGAGVPSAWLLYRVTRALRPRLPGLGPFVLLAPIALAALWAWRAALPEVARAWLPSTLVPLLLLVVAAFAAWPRRAASPGEPARSPAASTGGATRSVGVVVRLLGALALPAAFFVPVSTAQENRAGRAAVEVVRFFADGDGDGFSAAFAGGDCDDDDPEVHPLALEIVGNGVDDNCRAGDLARVAPLPTTRPVRRGPPRDVVLISVDTWRADMLTPELTPNLWAFAQRGRRFTRAWAAAPFTDLSLRAVFTGWPPSDFDHRTRLVGMDRPLADVLAEAGWATFALHSIPELGELVVLGFQNLHAAHARLHAGTRGGSSAPQITATALGLLRSPSPKPRLLWVHYLEPHHHYLAHPGFEHLGDDLEGRYRQEVAFTDAQLKPLLDWLSRPEVSARTVVVLFSDHGEYLGEFGRHGHDYSLYPPVLRVPLVVRAPDLAPAVVEAPVSLLDVFPTVLELAGVEGVEARGGRSLLDPDPARRVLAEARGSSRAPPNVALVEDGRLLHCGERDRRCQLIEDGRRVSRSDEEARLRAALDAELERYRNDVRHAARRAAWAARWGKK